MKFMFRTEPQHVEAENLEKALAWFSTLLWFPGIIFAKEIKGVDEVGDEINLRAQTPEGIIFEKTRAKNKQNATYGHLALLELVKLCEGYGIKQFKFEEDGDCQILLNEKGKSLQEKSIKEAE